MKHLLRQRNMASFRILLNALRTRQCIFAPSTKLKQFRTFFTGKHVSANYEGDGRTTVAILNRQHKNILMIDAYSSLGFRLNNGIFVVGPVAAFPRTVLYWNVNTASDISVGTLSLFALLEPKLDILVLGTGDNRVAVSVEVEHFLRSKKISAEILPTDQACNIFNFLNAEGRCVAGAFIPPLIVTAYTDELTLIEGTEPGINVFR